MLGFARSLLFISTTLALTACGKKVLNPSNVKLYGDQGGVQGGDAIAGTNSTRSGAATGTGFATQKALDDLQGLIDKEREERIAADQDLQTQLDALAQSLQQLETKLGTDIAALDKQGKDTQAQLSDYIKTSTQALADLEQKMTASDADLAKKLRDELGIELQKIRDSLATASDAQKSQLGTLVADIEKKIAQSDAELAADLRAEAKLEIARIEAELDAFKREAAVTYATKAELQLLAASVEALKESLALATQKFDNSLRELSDRLSEQARKDVESLQQQIDALQADVKDLGAAVAKLAADIDGKIAAMRAEIGADLAGIRLELTQLQAQDALQIAAIKTLSDKLNERSEYLLRLFAALNAELTGRIDRLEQEIENSSDEQKAYVQAQIGVLETKLGQLAEEERQARAALGQQIQQIVTQIQALEVFARENRALIIANRDNIERDRREIERLRDELQTEMTFLNNEFKARLEEVKQIAVNMTIALGASVQEQFVTLNTQIASLNQRINSQIELMLLVLVDVIGRSDVAVRQVKAFFVGRIPPLSRGLNQIGFDRVALENEVVNLLTPFTPATGVNPAALNQEFRQLLSDNACDGVAGVDEQPAALANREWFMHIAGEYAVLLAAGIRSGSDEHDKIFFRLEGAAPSPDTIPGAMQAAVLASHSNGNSCQRAVTAWARAKFLGNDAQAAAIRAAIAASARIKERATKLMATILTFRTTASTFETDFVAAASAAGKDPALIRTWLFTSIEAVRPIDRIIAYILDSAEDYRQLADIEANRDRIFQLAKAVAAQQEALGQVTRSVAQLNADFDLLKDRVDKLARSTDDVKKALTTLKESQIVAFELIAAIAGRLGFRDIVDRADDEIESLGGTLGVRVPEGCYAVQHFYNHATNPRLPVARCQSLMTTSDRTLSDLELSRCAIHGGFMRGGELIAYTWGNEKLVANGWAARHGTIEGHAVTDGLLIRQYDPSDPQAKGLAGRASGSAYPADKESTLVYRVLGNAAKLKFEVISEANPGKWPYTVTVDANEHLKGQTGGLNVYEVPLPKAISKLGACTWNRRVKVTALSAQGAAGRSVCEHRFHTFSPVVLNLGGRAMIATVPPTESRTWFDLDANGIVERTGWITGDSALLARDRNGNGRIDDGSELFGEATPVLGRAAVNGYEALAELDENRDGILDRRDRAFSELLVWKDINGDGASQVHELRPVDALGITAIDTRYERVDESQQLQADAQRREANLVKYRSTYHMPGCGEAGCASFDVYFGSSEYTATAAK
jgi:hypothetical protein